MQRSLITKQRCFDVPSRRPLALARAKRQQRNATLLSPWARFYSDIVLDSQYIHVCGEGYSFDAFALVPPVLVLLLSLSLFLRSMGLLSGCRVAWGLLLRATDFEPDFALSRSSAPRFRWKINTQLR